MTTLTGRNRRTIGGYIITLLDYPRWIIEREVDFTDCHLRGDFGEDDPACDSCRFGAACRWLNVNRNSPSADAPLDELMTALRTAVEFLRRNDARHEPHPADCDCDNCQWLRDATGFLRQNRHWR